MRFPSAFPGFILASLSTANAAAINPPTQPLSQALSNATLTNLTLSDGVDSRFQIRAQYDDPDLNSLSCLFNAVNALALLADADFLSRLPGSHRFTLPAYSNVDIAFEPVPPATDIEVRVMVWGLYYGIYDMLEGPNFKNVTFDLLWQRVLVAQMRFEKPTDAEESATALPSDTDPSLNNTNATANTLTTTNNLTTTTTKTTDPNPPNPTFAYIFEGEKLYLQEVFITVLATLKTLAEYPADNPVSPFATGAQDVDAKMSFVPSEHPSTIPALRYRDVTAAVKQVPAYMLENGMFAELVILFMVGEVEVGTGLIEQGGSDSGGRIANASQLGGEVLNS